MSGVRLARLQAAAVDTRREVARSRDALEDEQQLRRALLQRVEDLERRVAALEQPAPGRPTPRPGQNAIENS